jgi:hypothetical protein
VTKWGALTNSCNGADDKTIRVYDLLNAVTPREVQSAESSTARMTCGKVRKLPLLSAIKLQPSDAKSTEQIEEDCKALVCGEHHGV